MAVLSGARRASLLLWHAASPPSGDRAQIFAATVVPLRRGVIDEGLLHRTIKYNKMGWGCLGNLLTDCTSKCQLFCSLCECSDNKRAISP